MLPTTAIHHLNQAAIAASDTMTEEEARQAAEGILAIFMGLGIVLILVSLVVVVGVYVLITFLYYNAFKKVPEKHQKIKPGMVWLRLLALIPIPFVNVIWLIVWDFICLAFKIPESFKSYFDEVGDDSVGDCGKGLGIALNISFICLIIPFVNILALISTLVLFIIYLVKIYGLAGRIGQAEGRAAEI